MNDVPPSFLKTRRREVVRRKSDHKERQRDKDGCAKYSREITRR